MTRPASMLAAVILLACALPARAHDFGAMLVSIVLHDDGRYAGDIRVDPQHLPAPRASALLSADSLTRAESRAALGSELQRSIHLRFDAGAEDAVTLTPRATTVPDDGLLHWNFAGSAPRPARSLTWRCDAPLGRFLFRAGSVHDEECEGQWLDPGATSDEFVLHGVAPEVTTARVVADHLRLGFTHIIPGGLDHILFVLGLFLLSARVRPVLAQATAFTVAHSITLALAVCGVVSPPPAIVEPLIAASIAFVGIENVLARGRTPTARRTIMVFAFGLLHGLGFAGVLRETGLPPGRLVPALISFNIGVELGQAAVILGAFLLVGAWFGRRRWYHQRIAAPASVAIAGVALFWTIQRLGI